jgi:hypothetical protein
MSKHWYCKLEGKEQGPFSASELKGLVSEGRLRPEDPIRRDDHKKWTSAWHVKGLFPEGARRQSSPPPLPKIPGEGEKGDSSPVSLSGDEPEPNPAEEETVLPVMQVEAPRAFLFPTETDDDAPFSRRHRPQKKTQLLALALLGGVIVLGILLILVFTGVLGPSRTAPEKSGPSAVDNNTGSPQPDAAPEEVEKK